MKLFLTVLAALVVGIIDRVFGLNRRQGAWATPNLAPQATLAARAEFDEQRLVAASLLIRRLRSRRSLLPCRVEQILSFASQGKLSKAHSQY
jgi:hypothetical protein